MSANSYKAQAIAHDLAARYKERGLATSLGAIVESFDTDGNPVISIGDGVAGDKNAVLKVMPVSWPLAQDVLGLTANQFCPHKIMLCTEANNSAGAGADILTLQNIADVLGQLALIGTQIEWYQTANATAPSVAGMVSGNLKATFWPDNRYPLISAQ